MRLSRLLKKQRLNLSRIVAGGLVLVLLLLVLVLRLAVSANQYSYQNCLADYVNSGYTEQQAGYYCQQYKAATAIDQTDTGSDRPANLVGRARVVKNSWRWMWPEYGYQPVEGVTPIVLPFYDKNVIDPLRNVATNTDYTNAQYDSLKSVSQTAVPGLPGVLVSASCGSTQGNLPKRTDLNGYAEFSEEQLSNAGCARIDQATVTLGDYGGYGSPTSRSSATYPYYFGEKSGSLKSITLTETVASPVLVAYRPAVLGSITNEYNQTIPGAKLCLFYRQPAANDPCDKDGLSTSGAADSSAHYVVFASWGDYQQKGGGPIAHLVAELNSGRQSCGPAFSINGDTPTMYSCKVTTAGQTTTGTGTSTSGGTSSGSRSLVPTRQSTTRQQATTSNCDPSPTTATVKTTTNDTAVVQPPTTGQQSGPTTSQATTQSGSQSLLGATRPATGNQAGSVVSVTQSPARSNPFVDFLNWLRGRKSSSTIVPIVPGCESVVPLPKALPRAPQP